MMAVGGHEDFLSVNNKVALAPIADIERVAYCLGICLAAFSKEPFDEKWSFDGTPIPGMLLNPRTAGLLVVNIFKQKPLRIAADPDGGEWIGLDKQLLLSHIDGTLNDPMTPYFCDTKWISASDIESLKYLKEKVLHNNKKTLPIYMSYPLTKLSNTYVDATKNPYSLLWLGYHKEWSDGTAAHQKDEDRQDPVVAHEIKLLRIKAETVINGNVFPVAGGRYITLNHPYAKTKVDVTEYALIETGCYLDSIEQKDIRRNVDPHAYTTYLGEVAKIPDVDKNFKVIHLSGLKYLEVLTGESTDGADANLGDLVPKQMLYMSLPGTAVASESKANRGNSWLFQALKMLAQPYGLEYTEDILTFSKPDGQTVLFGVIKQV